MGLNLIDIPDVINEYVNENTSIQNHRYKSWEHCYKFFNSNIQELRESKEEDRIDLACLNLAFYLASWGMYRGSSGLLWRDYKIYNPLITNVILDEKYDSLWAWEMGNIPSSIDVVDKVYEVYGDISDKINKIGYVEGKPKVSISATGTLVTKIMLGTFGCTPAYDNFFRDGCRFINSKEEFNNTIKPYTVFNKKSFSSLMDFFQSNIENGFTKADERCRNELDVKYPPMKLLDMYLWQVGYELSN